MEIVLHPLPLAGGTRMIIDDLITDRTQADADRIAELKAKGWRSMTEDERLEWMGAIVPLRDTYGDYVYDINGDTLYCLVPDGVVRGGYNCTDLNRVESAVSYLADALNGLTQAMRDYAAQYGVAWESSWLPDYAPGDLTTKTNWAMADEPTPEDLDRYIQNIFALNTVSEDASDVPKSLQTGLSVSGANAIERLLIAIDGAVKRITAETEDIVQKVQAAYIYSGEIYSGEMI
jgi:hypothetical protein